jgi:hypothetical protein
MKLLSSILLASASVMAVQRREDDSTVDHDAMNAMDEVHDMTDSHDAMEPSLPDEIEHTEETSTPHGVHNVTVVHTTQSTIEHLTTAHTIVNTTHDYFPPTPPPHHTEDHHDSECEDTKCGCNAEEMARWEMEMSEWKYDQNIWKMEFNKWIHEYGSDDEIHNWEHDMEHDTGADAEIGWDILQILTQAGQICPLMNLLSDTGLELGNLNLQEECDFQAAELAGLAKVFLSLSSSSSENWSHQFCDYLATMISEELTRYGAGVLVPDSAKQTCSCLVNILMQGPMEVDATAIPLCASNALNLISSFTGSS